MPRRPDAKDKTVKDLPAADAQPGVSAADDGSDLVTVEVPAEAAGQRLDKWLAGALTPTHPDLSRARIQSLIAAGNLMRNGAVLTDGGVKLAGGQSLYLTLPPPVEAKPLPEAIPLAIVHEDDALIVIDKPAGLVVHPAAGHGSGTLVNALLHHCGASLSGIGGVARPGIVHRLDKDTSGLMVVAKTDRAHRKLAAQFADHGRTGPLERRYVALVWGEAPIRTTIEANLDRHTHDREKIAVVRRDRGREAITHVERLALYGDAAGKPFVSLVACTLETGRTHQIRVHMAHIGHPLLGDAVYGSGFRTKVAKLTGTAQAALAALNRQALHAELLGFEHPVTGETMVFESDPPADMAALMDALGPPLAPMIQR
ncbi:MAG: RluA family pseudouridine synthase [Beijerinckiaceae bacterium]